MKTQIFDRLGIFTSTACALHCFLMPFLITFLPYFGLSFLANEAFEIIILCISFFLALLSCCFGFKVHYNKKVFLMFSFGFLIIILGRFAHEFGWEFFSTSLLFLGGLTVALSHRFNNVLCKTCVTCKKEN